MNNKKIAKYIFKVLRENKDVPFTGKQLIAYLENHSMESDVTDGDLNESDIRIMINLLRMYGKPVCASKNGYFYTKNKKKLDKYINGLRSRGQAIIDVANSMSK